MELLGRHVSSSPTQATLSQLYFLYLSFCLQQLQWRCSILRLMGSFCFDRIMFQQCLITSVQMLWLMGRLWIWVSGIQQVDFSLTSIIFQSMILIFFFHFYFLWCFFCDWGILCFLSNWEVISNCLESGETYSRLRIWWVVSEVKRPLKSYATFILQRRKSCC